MANINLDLLSTAEQRAADAAAKAVFEYSNAIQAPGSKGCRTSLRQYPVRRELSRRMEQVWTWINALPDQADRKLIYAWSWVKVRKGVKISAFASENDLNERTLRRAVTAVCQRIANNLNRNYAIRLDSADLQVSENQPDITPQTVTSESCVKHWRSEDAKPQIDPAHAQRRVLDHREIRAR